MKPDFIVKPIIEFWSAVKQSFSYNLRRNVYIWFGICWGLPIPFVTIVLQVHFFQTTGVENALLATLGQPVQWFFLAHPILFGLVFGALGTIRFEKDAEILRMLGKLQEQSNLDPLTGLKNRRYFAHLFHDECARSLRRREPLTLLFLDLDHFKRVNDTHGHHFGDMALQAASTFFKGQCRPYDTIVRWGGEEFVILLRATDESAAVYFAERIRQGIKGKLQPALPFTLSISIGLAQYQDNDTLEDLSDRADQALYFAKKNGRDRVVCWSVVPAAKNWRAINEQKS